MQSEAISTPEASFAKSVAHDGAVVARVFAVIARAQQRHDLGVTSSKSSGLYTSLVVSMTASCAEAECTM